ncbi:MAG TPA: exopolysaccharide biosynthesis protein [Gammaproteobacteria bacterium]|nr:exopolysaccharide biosynthesis protein [Gammaproteobacteria bacterium]
MDAESHGGLRARLRRPLPERTSEVLREIAAGDSERVTFRDILTVLRHRVFGFTLLVFALPCSLPMPPGIPTVCGVALVIIALNLIAARQRLWLPGAIADKSVARADLQRIVERAVPYLERLERVCKPRFAIVTEPVGKVLIGLVILVLGFIMILPIPFLGNIPPGFAATFIAIGMTERDGLVVLIGLLVSAIAIAVASVATWSAVLAIVNFFSS